MIYKTKQIRNLFTGEPFTLEVDDARVAKLEKVVERVKSGEFKHLNEEKLVRSWELSFFPCYQDLLEIFSENGYTDELMAKILKDFEVPDNFAQKLMEDEQFIGRLKGRFEGITCDGERASRTLGCVYDAVGTYFKVKQQIPRHEF